MVRHRILVPIFAGSSPATVVLLMADETKRTFTVNDVIVSGAE